MRFTHLVALSSSANDGENTPFDIRASIDLTVNEIDTKIMKSFHCTAETSKIDQIMSQIEIVSTLSQWIPVFQGAMYDGSGTNASSDANKIIGQILNSMIMVEGGSNNLLHTPTGDTSQGCIISRTSLPVAVIVLSSLAGAVFLATTVYWLFLEFAIQSAAREDIQAFTELPEKIPSGLVLWMLQAARESTLLSGNVHFPEMKPAELVEWKYTRNGRLQKHANEGDELAHLTGEELDRGN